MPSLAATVEPPSPADGVPSTPTERRAAAILLRRALIGDQPSVPAEIVERLLGRTTPDAIRRSADYHGVAGWLRELLDGRPDLDPTLRVALDAHHDDAIRWHLRALWQLDRVAATLDGAGIPWVVVKGPVLVDLLHGPLGRRWYHDLDLLVAPRRFEAALDALVEGGARLLDRNWPLLRRERRAQVHLRLESGLLCDLHWDLVNVHRRHMAMDTAGLLRRRETVDLGGLPVPTLDPADTIVHLAVHAALSGGDKLVWIKDLERAVTVRPPDWDAVVARSRVWHVAGAVGLMLERARDVLHAPVPDPIPPALLGTTRHRAVRWVDALDPVVDSGGGPRPGRALARTIGHGPLGGAIVMARRAIRHFDPRGPDRSSPFTAAGDERDRSAYFRSLGS